MGVYTASLVYLRWVYTVSHEYLGCGQYTLLFMPMGEAVMSGHHCISCRYVMWYVNKMTKFGKYLLVHCAISKAWTKQHQVQQTERMAAFQSVQMNNPGLVLGH